MDECFSFESKYRETNEIKVLNFQTTDGTEWKLTEEWLLAQRRNPFYLQRIKFFKENHYERHYFINLEITSVENKDCGKIQKSRKSYPVFTTFIIPLKRYQAFKYKMDNPIEVEVHGVNILVRALKDDFRYKVTITSAYIMEDFDPVMPTPPPRDRILVFSDQIHSLLETGMFSDVVLTDGLSQIRAHWNILCMRSEYFRTMFQQDMEESKEGIVYIKDTNMDVLREVLDFMYSGVLNVFDIEKARDIYIVADKYQTKELKKACCDFLLKYMDVSNFICILDLATTYADEYLKHKCLDFILEQYENVSKSENWTAFENNYSVLFNEVKSLIENPPAAIRDNAE